MTRKTSTAVNKKGLAALLTEFCLFSVKTINQLCGMPLIFNPLVSLTPVEVELDLT